MPKETIKANLRFLRKTMGFSQQYIANQLGIKRGRYETWERNCTPSLEMLHRISILYDPLTIDDLVRWNIKDNM